MTLKLKRLLNNATSLFEPSFWKLQRYFFVSFESLKIHERI